MPAREFKTKAFALFSGVTSPADRCFTTSMMAAILCALCHSCVYFIPLGLLLHSLLDLMGIREPGA